jgi:serine O-acetyltransferase
VFRYIYADFERCGPSFYARVKEALFNPAMWSVFTYRALRWVRLMFPRPVRWLFALATLPVQVGMQLLTHVQISHDVPVGPGLYLPHVGFIVVSSKAVIGSHCTIGHGVTIGHAGGRNQGAGGAPVLGNRVYVGPGAIILGPITVGDDALIGAGAVVVKTVPPRGVVVGNPARLIAHTGSFALIEYPGMENDVQRRASFEQARPTPGAAGRELAGV